MAVGNGTMWPELRRVVSIGRLAMAIALVAASAIALLLRFIAPTSPLGVAIAALVPLGVLAALGAIVVDRNRRRSPRTAAAVGLLAVSLLSAGVLLPLPFSGADQPVDGVVVVTSNLRAGNPTVELALDDLFAVDADVLVLQEVTDEHGAALESHEMFDTYPHRVLDPRPGFYGSAILSRVPAIEADVITFDEWPATRFRLDIDGVVFDVVNIHLSAPISSSSVRSWDRQLNALHDFVDDAVPTALVGDFNATQDHRQFRSLLDAGYVDVTRDLRWAASWPVRSGRVPLLHLDHILVEEELCGANPEKLRVTGSDHVAFLATVGVCVE